MVAVSAVTSLLTIALSFALVGPLGITGVALGVLLGVVLSQSIYLGLTSRYLQISVPSLFWKTQGRPLLAGTVCLAMMLAMSRLIGKDSYGVMAAGALVSFFLYVPVAFASLHSSERQKLLRLLRAKIHPRRGAAG
jgi:O-antigen/teichoic acid export membrane protein